MIEIIFNAQQIRLERADFTSSCQITDRLIREKKIIFDPDVI